MKTPSISVSMSRKQAIYSGTRRSIARPGGGDADRHQEGGEHDQHQGDAVDAERPGEARRTDPAIFDELPLRPADLVGQPRARSQSASTPSVVASAIQRAPLRAGEQAGDRAEHRQREDRGEDGKARHPSRHRPGGGGGDAEQHHQRVGVEIAGLDAGGERRARRPRQRRRRPGRSGRSCPRRRSSTTCGRATSKGGRRSTS